MQHLSFLLQHFILFYICRRLYQHVV